LNRCSRSELQRAKDTTGGSASGVSRWRIIWHRASTARSTTLTWTLWRCVYVIDMKMIRCRLRAFLLFFSCLLSSRGPFLWTHLVNHLVHSHALINLARTDDDDDDEEEKEEEEEEELTFFTLESFLLTFFLLLRVSPNIEKSRAIRCIHTPWQPIFSGLMTMYYGRLMVANNGFYRKLLRKKNLNGSKIVIYRIFTPATLLTIRQTSQI